MLKLENQELTSNLNIEEHLANLHEKYVAEIEQLSSLLAQQYQHTQILLQAEEREKNHLKLQIDQLKSQMESEKKNMEGKIKKQIEKQNLLSEKLESAQN